MKHITKTKALVSLAVLASIGGGMAWAAGVFFQYPDLSSHVFRTQAFTQYNDAATFGVTLTNNYTGNRSISLQNVMTTDQITSITGFGPVLQLGSNDLFTDVATGTIAMQSALDAVDLLKFDLKSSNANTANGDKITQEYMARASTGTTRTLATERMQITDVTNASEDAKLVWAVITAGTLADELALLGASLAPTTDDGLDLGTTALRWGATYTNGLDADGLIDFHSGVIQGASPLVFEGTTADAFETTIAIVDPTADQTISVPNNAVASSLVTSALTTNAIGGANSVWLATNSVIFEGATADGFETTLAAGDAGADYTVTLPAYTGTLIATGRVSQIYYFTDFIAGAGAGWVVTGANNGRATLPAGQSAATLVIRLTGLHVGDTITAFTMGGQVESAGNTATLDATLYKNVAAAGDITQTDIGAITQVSVTADAIVSASKTLDTPEVIAADETFYILVTGTTAAATDFDLQGAKLTITGS